MNDNIKIYKYGTNKVILSAVDLLHVVPGKGRILFEGTHYDPVTKKGTAYAVHFIDTSVMKSLCHLILSGNILKFTGISPEETEGVTSRMIEAAKTAQDASKKSILLYEEMKGSRKQGGDYDYEARIFRLTYSPSFKLPWGIHIANGEGKPSGKLVSMVKVHNRVVAQMNGRHLVAMAAEILDYIRNWETTCFIQMQSARAFAPSGSDDLNENYDDEPF